MIHIPSFINSMKLTWLKRTYNSRSDWMALATQELPDFESLLTYSNKKIKMHRDRMSNPFYIDMIDAVMKFNKENQQDDEEILTEKIWYSNWTKFETSMIKMWDEKGLRFIGDLYNPSTGEIYSQENLEQVYGIRMTFLCYSSLIRSPPNSLQKQINKTWLTNPNIPHRMNLALNHTKFPRYAYNVFVNKQSENNAQTNRRLKEKWTSDIGKYTTGTLRQVATATTSTFLIYLHFRIINRTYATNKYLQKINVSRSNICTFCKLSVETIFHVFWECSKTQIFIKEILSHLKTNYEVTLNIDVNKWFLLTELSNMEVLVITLINPRPAGPLDFPPPAGGGGAFERPPMISAPGRRREKRKAPFESPRKIISKSFRSFFGSGQN